MIEFKNIVKLYDKNSKALDGINFNISKGEFIFIVGESGSGKSTLLKLLTSESSITSGKIVVDGINISSLKRKNIPYYKRKLGVVFQDFRLIERLNVFENIAFPLNILNISNADIQKRVNYVLNLVGLTDKSKRKISELSGGEKQRVGIARAIVNNPKILIADEPTGNIDPAMSIEIVNLLSNINKSGTTVIMVTHDMSIVKMFPFRVVKISKGKVINNIIHGGDYK